MKKTMSYFKAFLDMYAKNRIPRAAAGLSYYLTLTLFPLVICLYSMLGSRFDEAMRVVGFLENFLAEETVTSIKVFLVYVSNNSSPAMMLAGFTLLLTSASAAVRSIQSTIGDVQGNMRYKQLPNFLISIAISLFFVLVLYIGIFVMMSGRAVINKINDLLPFVDISSSWNYLRFIIFAGLIPVMLHTVYGMCRDKKDRYALWPGVLFSTMGSVAVSIIFSVFIGASARYPLVYGSLASVILLMVWIYFFSISMYCGAGLNVVIRDAKSAHDSEDNRD